MAIAQLMDVLAVKVRHSSGVEFSADSAFKNCILKCVFVRTCILLIWDMLTLNLPCVLCLQLSVLKVSWMLVSREPGLLVCYISALPLREHCMTL